MTRSGSFRGLRLAALLGCFVLAEPARGADCDGDGTPDEAEILAGAPDCNGNGIPDACDLIGTPFGILEVSRIPSGLLIFGLDAADLDGDGAGDVAACTHQGVHVFLQRAAGEFEVRELPMPSCNGIGASDLDGDGDVDLAISTSAVVILQNSGTGHFQQTGGYGALTGHSHMTPVDIDMDGDVDIVSIAGQGSGVSILSNQGNGVFPSQTIFGAPDSPSRLAVADLDGDGDPDLAVVSQARPEVIVFPNTDGHGAFGPGMRILLDFFASGLVAADLDGRGGAELVVSLSTPGRICILRRQGEAFERTCRPTGADHTFAIQAADMSSDGITDLLLLESAWSCATLSASLSLGDGAGGLLQPMSADVGYVNGPAIVRDVIGDSGPEIVIFGQGAQPEQGIRFLRAGPGPPLPDCNGNGVPDGCEIPGSDWNFNGRLDSCEIREGLADCDGNGVPDAQDADCDANGLPDGCDIASGALEDLDGDGIPDLCEPAPGPFVDCNGNNVADAFDLGAGASADCNANRVPDECDLRRYVAEPRRRLHTQQPPVSMALPDLDGDGSADAAVLATPDLSQTHLSKKTSLFLSRNGGSWSARRDFPAGPLPARIASGDLDGNGSEDLLTSNLEAKCLSPGFVSAFLNRGEGDMEQPRIFAQGLRPTWMAVGDLDGDGDLDVALAGEEKGHGLFVFLNDGSGRFDRAGGMGLPGPPSDLIASDLDGDSDMDLAVGLPATPSVALFRNGGKAGFTAGPVLPASFPPARLAAADLEGKGSMDIVLATGPISANALFLFENDGTGGFGEEEFISVPISARLVHALDGDGDGRDDLALAGPMFVPGGSPNGDDLLYLRSRGGREFDIPALLDRGLVVSEIATGDTDADGRLDLAVADIAWHLIRFYRNAGEHGFDAGFRHPVGDGISALIASDLDQDGSEEVLAASTFAEDITLLPSSGGRIAGGKPIALGLPPQAVTSADLDGDGDGDLIAAGGFEVQTLLREESGSFSPGNPAVLNSPPMHVMASDLDGDGDVDVATANVLISGFNDNVSVIANDGAGRLGTPHNFAIGIHPRTLCAADLDSDGDIDLVTSNSETEATMSFLWNGGGGDFSLADTRPSREMRGLFGTDLDGDGLEELIGAANEGVAILENRAGGAFVERLIPVRGDRWPLDVNWYGFAGADIEGDGDIDLVLADPARLLILENRGGLYPSTPEVQVWLPAEGSGASGTSSSDPSLLIALPDLDGDGHRDLAFAFPSGNEVLVLRNRGKGSPDLDLNGVPDECNAPGVPFRRGEANGDGTANMSDAISVLRWLFSDGSEIPCLKAGDGNDDGRVDLSDPVWLLRHLYLGTPPPYEPFLACGQDPTPDALGCVSFPECGG